MYKCCSVLCCGLSCSRYKRASPAICSATPQGMHGLKCWEPMRGILQGQLVAPIICLLLAPQRPGNVRRGLPPAPRAHQAACNQCGIFTYMFDICLYVQLHACGISCMKSRRRQQWKAPIGVLGPRGRPPVQAVGGPLSPSLPLCSATAYQHFSQTACSPGTYRNI